MATKIKTSFTDVDVTSFINTYVENEEKRQDSFALIELMQTWSKCAPKMYGPTIVGFGAYHYKYASGHEGDAVWIGFSPRKAEFSLYTIGAQEEKEVLLPKLGKYKMGKGCIYFKKLADIDIKVLEKICKASIKYVKKTYTTVST
jgi:Domain of unknown function (DU1801)